MKKIIEEVVTKDINLVEMITNLAEKGDVWIFISLDLVQRLKENYDHHNYAIRNGIIFVIWEQPDNPDFSDHLYVEDGNSIWNRIAGIPKQGVYLSEDPKEIYFLSQVLG